MYQYSGNSEHKRQSIDQTVRDLKTLRNPYESLWGEIDDYIAPGMLRLQLTDNNRGERDDTLIINSTATQAHQVLENGMVSHVSPSGKPWVKFKPENPELEENGEVSRWCDDVAAAMLDMFEEAGVYEALQNLYSYMGAYANGCMWVEEDLKYGINCQTLPLGSFWIGKDKRGDLSILYREFQMTVSQLVAEFCPWVRGEPDLSNTSDFVKECYRDGKRHQTMIDLGHIVMPNPKHDPNGMSARELPYTSCYWELAKQGQQGTVDVKFLRESGYDLFPALIGQWNVIGRDVWSKRCPGITTLGDTKELQHWTLVVNKAADKTVDPPMMGPPWIKQLKVGFLPGQLTAVPINDLQNGGMRPLHDAPYRVLEAQEREQTIIKRIERGFHVPTFLMLDYLEERERTATEIQARQQEKLEQMVGVLNRLNRGVLNPLVDRAFQFMLRQERIQAPPKALGGSNLKVEYISTMAQAMRAIGMNSIDRVLSTVITLAEPAAKLGHDVFDKLDIDQVIDETARGSGAPARIIRDDKTVAAMREERQAQQQAAAQAEQIAMGAKAAKDLASADTEKQNALTDIVGALGGGGRV